ncbi:MAG: efflux RND transporter periplasmic adaptor subunit [Phycisphaerae bacterium]
MTATPHRSRTARWAALLVAALCVASCDRLRGGNATPASQPATTRPAPAVPVAVRRATREDFKLTTAAIGWVEPLAVVTIKPQVSGQIVEAAFREGDELKAGQVLFEIDRRPFEAALQLARATLRRDAAMAEDARQEAERTADLFGRGQESERQRDQTRLIAESKAAQVAADEADVRQAELNLEYCTIRAPIEGRAGRFLVDRGNVVKANETELLVINQLSPIYVTFSLPERFVTRVKAAMAAGEVPVSADADEGAVAGGDTGVLAFIDNQVDASTAMIKLKARFENGQRHLWPGQFVRTKLTIQTLHDVVVVPSSAVQPGQRGAFVYVVSPDQTVSSRSVLPGETFDSRTVVASGLNGDETVVTDGHLRLTNGSQIFIKREPGEPPAGAAGAAIEPPRAKGAVK